MASDVDSLSRRWHTDIAQASLHWCQCDGEQDCGQCALHDPDPDKYSICDLFNEAACILEGKGECRTMMVYTN